MKRIRTTILLAAVIVAAALWWAPSPLDERASFAPAPATAPPASTGRDEPHAFVEDDGVTQLTPAAHDPHVQQFEARAEFHHRVREFFARAPSLPLEVRERQAQQLDAEITRYEQARELSADEALLLRLGLVRETSAGETRRERMLALQDSYQRAAEERRAAHAARPDPMFEVYKAREREIVAQVQSMNSIPDGMSREEYLRRRLQEEREQLLRSN